MRSIQKSKKLADVCYDIRGPVLDKAKQMEDEGHKIIKLNIGNLAVFGFDAPDEIIQDMIRNMPAASAYTDSKGLFAPRKSVMHYTQEKNIAGVSIDDIYLGNGASELIMLSMNALLNSGDEVLVPAPDYPLWTAAVSLSGGNPVHYVCDEQSDWLPDIDDIKKKINSNTKAIVVINPNNPTGAAVSGRSAAADRRGRAPAPSDRVRRRNLRQGAVRRRPPHLDRLAGRRRAVHHPERLVEELPFLRLSRRLDGGVGPEKARPRLHPGPEHADLDAHVRQRAGPVRDPDRARRLPEHRRPGRRPADGWRASAIWRTSC